VKTVRVIFEGGGPEDGLIKTLPAPLNEQVLFPRRGDAPVIVGLTTLPATVPLGRYVYTLSPFPDDQGRQRYQYEGEE
jgi:hypothetical protein